jgi:hypothetical protein
VAEVGLQGPRIDAVIRQLVAAGAAQRLDEPRGYTMGTLTPRSPGLDEARVMGIARPGQRGIRLHFQSDKLRALSLVLHNCY